MHVVSEGYSAAMIPPITDFRQTQVRVTVQSVVDSVESTVTDSVGAATRSRDDQVINGIYNARYRYATAEPNCWKLDGSTVLQPDPEQTDAEVGFVSDDVSDVNGDFAVSPYVEVTVNPVVSVKGLSVMFDLLDNEYATDFDVYLAYGASQTATINVTANASAIYNLATAYADLSLIKVTVHTWSVAGKFAKITEIGFGLVQQFGAELAEPLLSVNVIDEVDITTKTMPYGELVFEFYDTNDDFNVLTPSDRTKVFTEGTTISPELGVRTADGSYEFVLAGTYRFNQWSVSQNKVVRVHAVDLIGFAGPRTPQEQYGGRSKTAAYNAVVSFFNDIFAAGLNFPTNVEISTDIFPNTGTDYLDGPYASTVLDQLVRLAQWSMTIPYVDNTGVLRFKALTSTPTKVIAIENIFENPRMVRYDQIKGIRVYYYDVAVSSDITEIASASADFGAGTTLVFDVGYNYEIYDAVAFGGASVVSTTGFAYGKYTVIMSGAGGVTIRGKAWVIGKQFVEAPNTAVTDPKALWVEVDNPHICTLARASDVADWLLVIYARIAEVSFDWRGTPEVETLDVIDLEPQDGIQVDTIVLKNEWVHDGALKYSTKGAAMWLHP